MESLIAIISIVVGVLNIILFFKIWGMTNNVNEIRNLLVDSKERKKNQTKSNLMSEIM